MDITFLMARYGYLGWAEFHLGNYHRSKELLEKALAFFKHVGIKKQSSTLHLRLGIIEKSLGNRESALQHLQEAYFLSERLGMAWELEGAKALRRELNAENPSTQGTE